MTNGPEDQLIRAANSRGNSQGNFRVCDWCGYDANEATAVSCEVCSRPLRAGTVVSPSWLSGELFSLGFLVLLATGGSYWIWKTWTSQFATTVPPVEISRAPDIRLYRTLKDVPNVPRGLFLYGNAHAFAAIDAQGMKDAILKNHPGFQLRYTEPLQGSPGSTAGIAMLINGELSVAQSVRSLEDAEFNRARERNFSLEQVPIAFDGIAVYVQPDINLPGLSLNQLREIYLGKITNWNQVGGPNLAIVPFIPDPRTTSILKILLRDRVKQVGRNVQVIRDHTTGIRRISATPGAICLGAAAVLANQRTIRLLNLAKDNSSEFVPPVTETGQVNIEAIRDGTYPLSRRVFVVIRRDGSIEEQAGVAYANLLLSEEGQRIIQQAGFVPLH